MFSSYVQVVLSVTSTPTRWSRTMRRKSITLLCLVRCSSSLTNGRTTLTTLCRCSWMRVRWIATSKWRLAVPIHHWFCLSFVQSVRALRDTCYGKPPAKPANLKPTASSLIIKMISEWLSLSRRHFTWIKKIVAHIFAFLKNTSYLCCAAYNLRQT